MVFRKRASIFVVFLLFWSFPLFSNGPLKANLIIVGPGDPLYTYWGHIGIAVENDETGENLFYDFGNFSFYSENFYLDFAMGRMMYLGFVTPTDRFISYSLTEDRDLRVYPLNLDDEALENLDETLRWWVLPENREYLYDYFLNNCSTIIRDILDDVSGGKLKDHTESIPDRSFRHYARTGANPSILSEILLHYLLGSNLDAEITGWDRMFLPQAVAEFLMDIDYTGDDGIVQKLADREIILKESTRPPVPAEPRVIWPWMLLVGIAAGIGWRFFGKNQSGAFRIIGTAFRALVIVTVGLPGLILGFMMTFTDHVSAFANINIWPTFPTILVGLIPLFSSSGRKEQILSGLWTVNLIGLVLAIALRISGIHAQDAYAFWAFLAPLTLAASSPGMWVQERLKK